MKLKFHGVKVTGDTGLLTCREIDDAFELANSKGLFITVMLYLFCPFFVFNQFGDIERALLRNGNVYSSDDWKSVLEWIILDLAGVNFVKLLISLGEIMFFNRLNGKCQIMFFNRVNGKCQMMIKSVCAVMVVLSPALLQASLIPNGDLEWGTTDAFSSFMWDGAQWIITSPALITSDSSHYGNYCLEAAADGIVGNNIISHASALVTPGKSYQLSFDYKTTVGTYGGDTIINFRFLNQAYDTVIAQSSYNYVPAGTFGHWLTYKTESMVAPEGSYYIDVELRPMWHEDVPLSSADCVQRYDNFVITDDDPVDLGYNCLFMGHSFFAPILYHLPTHTNFAGIDQHHQRVVFHGGAEGAPAALWNSTAQDVVDAKAWIQTGQVDLIGLTGFTPVNVADYQLWIDFALQYNPDTIFVIQAPWQTYYNSPFWLYEWSNAQTSQIAMGVIDTLRSLYPQTRFRYVPQGRWMVELWRLFNQGNLPEVTTLKGPYNTSLFVDDLGHGGRIPEQLGVLMWLSVIYNIDLRSYQYDTATQANLKVLSHELLHENMLYCGINLIDWNIFAAAWGTTPNDPQWNQDCDLVSDSLIDIKDLGVLCELWLD